ncbi:MAG TPA: hypothetical protein VFQ22_13545 [Longimicrobiales bacterium]|nr:hypothetical protein [Longimicrobiales bacterium]
MSVRRAAALGAAVAAALALTAGRAAAQWTAGTGPDYLRFDFDEGLDARSAELLTIPVAVRIPATDALTFDVSSAWARGRVETGAGVMELSGPVDTGVRAAWQIRPWILVTLGANLPTGNSSHDAEEAIAAAVLSTDLLGFRETTFGHGSALTSSVALARTAGGFGLGLAAAYSVRGSFEPSAEQADLEYRPGSEARVRVGVDRNFGNSTLTLGASFISYTHDRAAERNLFKAGNRFRFDATYAFRMGAGVWTLYAADLVRQRGDLSLEVLDPQGVAQGTTEVETPAQNLLVAGVTGAVGLGGGFVFRPNVDFRLQRREDASGSTAGSGWILALGGDVPIRIFGRYDWFPAAGVLLGSIEDAAGADIGVFGLELRGTVRTSF